MEKIIHQTFAGRNLCEPFEFCTINPPNTGEPDDSYQIVVYVRSLPEVGSICLIERYSGDDYELAPAKCSGYGREKFVIDGINLAPGHAPRTLLAYDTSGQASEATVEVEVWKR